MKLRNRVGTIVAIPFLGILITATFGSLNAFDRVRETRAAVEAITETEATSKLIHELQVERGLSVGFISSKSESFRASLSQQIDRVDASVDELSEIIATLPINDAKRYQRIELALNRLTEIRDRVAEGSIARPELVSYYSSLIRESIEVGKRGFLGVADGSIVAAAAGYELVAEAKEFAGQQRAVGAVGFGLGFFNQDLRDRFLALGAEQAFLLKTATGYLEGAGIDLNVAKQADRRDVVSLEQIVRGAKQAGDLGDVSASDWFGESTRVIEAMRLVETEIFAGMKNIGAEAQSDATTIAVLNLLVAFVALLASLGALFFFGRQLDRQVGGLVDAVHALASRDFEAEIPNTENQSEFGVLAASLEEMRDGMLKDEATIQLNTNLIDSISSNQAMIQFDLTGKVLSANQNFLDLMGYTESEVVGRQHKIFCKEEFGNSQAYRDMWASLGRGEMTSGNFERVTKTGRTVYIQGAYTCVRDVDGNPVRVVKMASDITAMETERLAEIDARQKMRDELAQVVNNLNSALSNVADGDLNTRISEEFAATYEELREKFNSAVQQLETVMSSVVTASDSIRGEASQVATAADELAQRTESQAAALEQTAAALDEMNANVKSAADAAETASVDVSSTKKAAVASGRIVRRAVKAMSKIKKSSNQISQIIGVIEDIAYQTNLLALNAGVEAARAGDAGRGFAVVASEVQALATRSSDAAKEIKALISTSSKQVGEGVGLVDQTGEELSKIVKSISAVTELVDGIAASVREQSVGIGEINTAVGQLDEVTQQNAAMVEEANAASHNMRTESETLFGLVAQFNTSNGTVVKMKTPGQATAQRSGASSPGQPAATASQDFSGNAAVAFQEDALMSNWEEF